MGKVRQPVPGVVEWLSGVLSAGSACSSSSSSALEKGLAWPTSCWHHPRNLRKNRGARCGISYNPLPDIPTWLKCKESACQGRRLKRRGFSPWVGKILWRRKWQLAPVFLPGKSHGRRSLTGYCPWGRKELDTTEAEHAQVGTKVAERVLVQSLFFQLCCKKMISWEWEVLGVHTARARVFVPWEIAPPAGPV